ncbi:MAG: DsbE family thiol:disulfide interchange protein [Gammaproteobacteria bacterium]|nr:DsbE family thiol:disulfide interchange protein [Gammaproteobacteria bacterium]MCP5135634.1 DsbE family thiol:disulfide interchange protein [Gammaproteobacteria bacterium]
MKNLKFIMPLAIFMALAVVLYNGLGKDPKLVPSPLIGKAAPAFTLSTLQDPDKTISPADMKGQVWLLNIWATWCVTCKAEHEVLNILAQRGGLKIVGLNYKDERAAAIRWLKQEGNPYQVNAFDKDGRVGIDWGVTGTPETFIIDKKGVIRFKQIGAVGVDVARDQIIPLIKQLEAEPA